MPGFFAPGVQKKVDYIAAQFDCWKALFRSADNLLETLAQVSQQENGGLGNTPDPHLVQLIEETRRQCDDERRVLEATFDSAVLQLEKGANVEDTPPMVSAIPCDMKSITKLAAGKFPAPFVALSSTSRPSESTNLKADVGVIGRPCSAAHFNAPSSSDHEALQIDISDRSQSSLGLVGSGNSALTPSSMSYAAAVLRPTSSIPPLSSSSSGAPATMELCYQRLRDSIKRPEHYNLLENSPFTRYFVMRPTSPIDVLASIYHSTWSASTNQTNHLLSEAFESAKSNHASVYLFFSLVGTEEFCGVAQMMSMPDKTVDDAWVPSHARVFSRKVVFQVDWLYVKNLAFSRFKIRDQAVTPDRRPALTKEAADGTEIISSVENRLIGRRLVHSFHDLCSQGVALLQDREHFAQFWPQLRRLMGPGMGLGSSKLTAVDDFASDSDDISSLKASADNFETPVPPDFSNISTGDWPAIESSSTKCPVISTTPLNYAEAAAESPSLSPLEVSNIRYFIIRPAISQDVIVSIERGAWAAGSVGGHGRLHKAFSNMKARFPGAGHIYLFFSVWNSDRFCGVAEMISSVNFTTVPSWLPSFSKRRSELAGEFHVKWLHICDLPFASFAGRLFSLSTCKGRLAELSVARDCDELIQSSDGAFLMKAFSEVQSKVTLPHTKALPVEDFPALELTTPPPSLFDGSSGAPEKRWPPDGKVVLRTKTMSLSSDVGSYSEATSVKIPASRKPQFEKVKIGESILPATHLLQRHGSTKTTTSSVGGGGDSSSLHSQGASTFICGVCFTRGTKTKLTTLPCGHSCHEGCYTEWAKRNAPATCPNCRLREKPRRKPLSIFGPRF